MTLSLQFPVASTFPKPSVQFQPPPRVNHHRISFRPKPTTITSKRNQQQSRIIKAIEKNQEQSETVEEGSESDRREPDSPSSSSSTELSELGSEIKKVLAERKEKEENGDLWSGVADEIREIEWPPFGKVLGTTGVVLGVIAGSSVVLLTVNAVLAELSDKVFAGRGVQDFFG